MCPYNSKMFFGVFANSICQAGHVFIIMRLKSVDAFYSYGINFSFYAAYKPIYLSKSHFDVICL